jgi:hypothetical protein
VGVLAQLPICDRCNKPVDRLEEERDDFCARFVLTACCHGERERVVVEYEILESKQFEASAARAFVQPKQLGP